MKYDTVSQTNTSDNITCVQLIRRIDKDRQDPLQNIVWKELKEGLGHIAGSAGNGRSRECIHFECFRVAAAVLKM